MEEELQPDDPCNAQKAKRDRPEQPKAAGHMSENSDLWDVENCEGDPDPASHPGNPDNSAKRSVPWLSLISAARFRLRFEICGKGRPGSNAKGVRTGKADSVK